MPSNSVKPLNPILIPIVSIPHFLLGGLLAAFNWKRMGFPEKAGNTVKWSLVGTLAVLIIAYYIPLDTLKKMWSVGIGINVGAGLALRTIQLPQYLKAVGRERQG